MTDPRSAAAERREAARAALARRRRRVWTIRRRVAGMSLATLAATSAAVVIQMVTGHDPALGHSTRTITTPAAQTHTSTQPAADRSPAGATRPSTISTRAS